MKEVWYIVFHSMLSLVEEIMSFDDVLYNSCQRERIAGP
jgi:hypothetical protein